MARSRIVVETTDANKNALVESLGLQGETLADWFEEQVAVAVPVPMRRDEVYGECVDPAELADTATIAKVLRQQDWAFTDDDTRYSTHDLHPYPAKYIPQIPAHLIAKLSVRGDTVLDPFGGSATTAVEAVRMGRRAVSMDANPLSAPLGRVKSGFLGGDARSSIEQLMAALEGYVQGTDMDRSNWSDATAARYSDYIPNIPNMAKWFHPSVVAELALVRHLIRNITSGLAQDAANLALSRIVLRLSYQESETRYVSVPKSFEKKLALKAYLESIKTVFRRLDAASHDLQSADAKFITGDSRDDIERSVGSDTVDLIVTSPPYPNATDYHLYHRFRLFWLGFDPAALGNVEIGSHLRHQRDGTDFSDYCNDMDKVLAGCAVALIPGRYAAFVVGDALFKGEVFSTSDAIVECARKAGLDVVAVLDRPVHATKRSFAKPGRRARGEQLVILQKPNRLTRAILYPPDYKMWGYEQDLSKGEIAALTGENGAIPQKGSIVELNLRQPELWNLRRLTFSRGYSIGEASSIQPTWQRTLENGDHSAGTRKDPKYATHGLHAYKGKFYPQLAKSLLNMSGVPLGGKVLDPFCGSGTFLLEAMLNGFQSYGCDLNPLAAKIARSKTNILAVPRSSLESSIKALLERLTRSVQVPKSLEQFSEDTHEELIRWFPLSVLHKLNWLLSQIRLFGNPAIVEFLEVVLSSTIRDVSQQDPTDLRVRRRKVPLDDAPVLEIFSSKLAAQYERITKYWWIAGRQPGKVQAPHIAHGDSTKDITFHGLGLMPSSVDCVVTSPPYATALPYIDTDRLSLLSILGINSADRSRIEETITGTREIRRSRKNELEAQLWEDKADEQLPGSIVKALKHLQAANRAGGVGFRRENMTALLWSYFLQMRDNIRAVTSILKPGAHAYYVVGDSRTQAGENWVAIETGASLVSIAEMCGLEHIQSIGIDVTTDNHKHSKNAITRNSVLVFRK